VVVFHPSIGLGGALGRGNARTLAPAARLLLVIFEDLIFGGEREHSRASQVFY
jgi:hypothetical protein